MHDHGPRAEAAGLGEQLDRPPAVLGDAVLDFARLLVGVNVQDEPLTVRVAPDLAQPVRRTGPDRVGGNADRKPASASCSTA